MISTDPLGSGVWDLMFPLPHPCLGNPPIPMSTTQESKPIQSKGKHSTAIYLKRNCSRENEKSIILMKVESLQNQAQAHPNQGQEASKSSLEAPKSTLKSLLGRPWGALGRSWGALGRLLAPTWKKVEKKQ